MPEVKQISAQSPEKSMHKRNIVLVAGGATVGAEYAEGRVWGDYLDNIKNIFNGPRVDMRVINRNDDGVPQVLVSNDRGDANLIHLLQPGARIRRERKDGNVTYTATGLPVLVTAGTRENRWRLPTEGEDGRSKYIDLEDLVKPVNADGQAWRLEVPEVLPNDFEPATADRYPEVLAV